jgi:hypothetical protein
MRLLGCGPVSNFSRPGTIDLEGGLLRPEVVEIDIVAPQIGGIALRRRQNLGAAPGLVDRATRRGAHVENGREEVFKAAAKSQRTVAGARWCDEMRPFATINI